MGDIEKALGLVVGDLSDQNYAQSLPFCRFWSDIGQTYHGTPHDQIFNAIWNNRASGWGGGLIHLTAPLIVRFASDVESDHFLAPYSSGLQSRLCASSLQEFFNNNLQTVWYKYNGYGNGASDGFYASANLIAHWANVGCVEKATISNHILQSLISHPKLYEHQAEALIILFTLAGATFGAYTDPSVVDRCFELLKHHYAGTGHGAEKARLMQVCVPHPVKGPG